MTLYERLVIELTDQSFSHQAAYRTGGTPYELSDREPEPYDQQIETFAHMIEEADCVLVGGASGLSAAGGGDFYYEDNATYRRHFGKFAERYGFRGAFEGSFYRWPTAEARWGYLATFLDTTLNAPLRKPYKDLDAILAKKDFFVLTTNQDTQFVKLYPWEKVAEIQGDHRFFQCSHCCTDEVWNAVEPVSRMVEAMGDGLEVPTELVPRCPHCGAEAFPLGSRLRQLPARRALRGAVPQGVRLARRAHAAEDPFPRAGRGPHDACVYPGAVLGPHGAVAAG